MKKLIPQSIRNIYHFAQAFLANVRYGFPSRRIRIIGVTGTNGKTTTCQMIARILEEAGKKAAMASTINFKLGDEEWVNTTKYTTLSAASVQGFIKRAVDAGCEYLVLETSSHSLHQYRVWGVEYKTAVITNVTREHLDYHKTIEEYRLAKKRLFVNAKTAIVNLDMERPEEYLDCPAEKRYGYTTKARSSKLEARNKNSELEIIRAKDVELGLDHSKFQIQNSRFRLGLPGLFNIENALAAVCVGVSEGLDMTVIAEALGKMKTVPGRMEYVPNARGIRIIVDYAVTPDSLEKLYSLIEGIRSQKEQKIIAVFGSCGERDRGKRPIMGEIVSRYADFAIVTNEDPYGEDPEQIIDEVFAGVVKHKKERTDAWRIMDRRAAIRKALELADPGDIVVVTGKGAEETMAIKEERIPWNDKEVILEELDSLE
ncbi:MAG: UDP-N-acetylmuramoyl-L-alanyl-D-glutamate--2,6-diaminopimelate ligase [Candidatus Moranbacteria bacterium]|nr:UDP-N-acetylmuramoyl-L-alanyl-D-glutamate--2,6-diaminopimelate ligase [Candidatus Moranbacteria bacterium]